MSAGWLRKAVRSPHFWLVGPILGIITILHYFYFIGPIFGLQNLPPSLIGESTERMLYLLAMAYAGFVYGVVGGIMALVAAVAVMLPHAILISPTPRDAFLEIGAIALVGTFLLLWYGAHYKERRRTEQALLELGVAQEKLNSQIQAIRESERRSAALNVISALVNRSLEVAEVRESALEKVMEVMEAEVGWVYILDEETRELNIAIHRGLSEEPAETLGQIKLGEGLDGKAARSGQPVSWERTGRDFGDAMGTGGLDNLQSVLIALSGQPVALEDARKGFIGIAESENLRSALVAPLKSGDQVMGTIGMGTRHIRHFSAEETTLLIAIGTQIGVAVENIRLFNREQERRRQSAALSTVAAIVNQSLELEQVLDSALEKVSEVMGVDVGWVYLMQEETQEVVYAAQRGMSDEAAAILDKVKLGEGLNGKVAQSGVPMMMDDFSQDPGRVSRVAERENLQALLIAPLRSRGKIVGTIGVGTRSPRQVPAGVRPQGSGEFSRDEVELLISIGDQIGMAIENARLYQSEREIAQQLRDSENNYRDLFDNASDAIFVHDLEGNIIAANKALARLTGYTQEELGGMSINNLLIAESLSATREVERRQLEGGDTDGSYELILVRKDGTETVIELAARPITSGGQPVGFQHIARDVTEQRRRRESLRFYIREITRAQEEERKRLARELHDDTTQALVALSRDLDDLVSSETQLSEQVVGRLEKLREEANDMLEGVRRYSQDLRPSIVDDLGLLPGLEWLTAELMRQHGIIAEVKVIGEEQRLEPESELALFRIAQEALNNVRKHSQATRTEIVVEFGDGKVRMTVRDNGRGFERPEDISQLPSSGRLGLAGIQERTRLVGGNLTIESEPGEGTAISVEMPIVLDEVMPDEFQIPALGMPDFYF